MGCSFHEVQDSGNQLNSTGWDWASCPNADSVMLCTEDKFSVYSAYLLVWARADGLIFRDIDKAIGILLFISAGFTIGKSDVAALAPMRRRGKIARRKFAGPPDEVFVPYDPRAKASMSFWATHFPQWNRRCTVFLGSAHWLVSSASAGATLH